MFIKIEFKLNNKISAIEACEEKVEKN